MLRFGVVFSGLHLSVSESRGGIGEYAPTGVPVPSVEDAGGRTRNPLLFSRGFFWNTSISLFFHDFSNKI